MMWGRIWLAICLLFAVFPCAATCAESSVDSGRKSLTEKGSFPWYDSKNDDLKRIELAPPDSANAKNRQSSWEADPLSNPTTSTTSSSSFKFFSSLLNILVVGVLFLLFAGLIVLLVQAFLRREAVATIKTSTQPVDDGPGDADRVENLPFQVAAPRNDFLAEAERRYQAGDFNGAIIYLFSYKLIQLDKHHVIQLTRGKTNRQYWRETRRTQPELAAILHETIAAFEDVFFGHHSLDRDRFENCWRSLEPFRQRLQQLAEVAV